MVASLIPNIITVFSISGLISYNMSGAYFSMFILLLINSGIHVIYSLLYLFDKYITQNIPLITTYLFHIWDQKMESLGRKMVIMDREGNDPYLIRYYMLHIDRDDNGGFPFNIFIHKFVKGDDADKHDHPWDYFTLILNGGYYEEYEKIVDGRKLTLYDYRYPGFFQFVKSTHTHRVVLPTKTIMVMGQGTSHPVTKTECCWTLFIPFKKNREWGFWRKNPHIETDEKEWVSAGQYLKDRKNLHKSY
tara:strand:- start:1448 stop:2188 length:741 start_codon:yes stop_codon:yes gene_type:complete